MCSAFGPEPVSLGWAMQMRTGFWSSSKGDQNLLRTSLLPARWTKNPTVTAASTTAAAHTMPFPAFEPDATDTFPSATAGCLVADGSPPGCCAGSDGLQWRATA